MAIKESSKREAFNAGGFLLIGGAEEGSWEKQTCEIGARMPPLGNQPLSVSYRNIRNNNSKNAH